MSADVVHVMMTLRNQIKLYHWQTMSFPRHKATDDLVTKLDANIDQFVEVYIGKYGRPKFTGRSANIKLVNYHDKNAPKFIRAAISWLTKELPKHLKKEDTDLLNIRDTILADLNQVAYLFTLN
jgi:hypothetical protein